MNYRRNEDKWPVRETPAYNYLLDHQFSAESTDEPVTLAEVKDHLRIPQTVTDFDDILETLITECRSSLENFCKLSLIERTVTVDLNNSLGNAELPFGPLTAAVTSVHNYDGDAIASSDYSIKGLGAKFIEYPAYDFVRVAYPAGYTPENIPPDLKLALKKLIAYHFENAGNEKVEMPGDVFDLLVKGNHIKRSWLV